jgi:glycosyltransferase involved in cell wall biosynthesis
MRDTAKKLKIVHIGTADTNGGAAKASYALHKNLLALGHDSKMLVGYKYSSDKEIDSVWFNRGLVRRGLHHFLVGKVEEWTGMQSLIQPFRNVFLNHPFVRDADVINLHNLHGNFFSYTILPKLTAMAPTVWTLYDMWAMSDHCAFSDLYGCELWKTGKGKCPAIFDYPPIRRDTGEYLMKRKNEAYSKSKLHFVGPSKWMCEMAKQSFLLKNFPVSYIAQGIDTGVYRPVQKKVARAELGIPENVQVVLISALKNAPRKGLPYFLEALKFLKTTPRPFILVVGSNGLVKPFASGFDVKELGYIRSEEFLNKCYAASDVVVLPTLADNLPLTILNSLAAGTPVVSFNVGGVKEAVRHMQTGYLAKYKDASDLAHGIDGILGDKDLHDKMGEAGMKMVADEYTIGMQAEKYAELYEQLVRK